MSVSEVKHCLLRRKQPLGSSKRGLGTTPDTRYTNRLENPFPGLFIAQFQVLKIMTHVATNT
jgi:hypothetical protein